MTEDNKCIPAFVFIPKILLLPLYMNVHLNLSFVTVHRKKDLLLQRKIFD